MSAYGPAVNPWNRVLAVICLTLICAFSAMGQGGLALYNQVKAFSLTGGKADVTGLLLKRDRAEMTFNGTFYFTAPINGKVTGAVFIGDGTFRAAAPSTEFEKANLKRLIGVDDAVESDFKTAVLKFSDDTMETIGKSKTDGQAQPQAQSLAGEIDGRILKETGANLSARIALSILNQETPGFFFANFDGGRRGRFSYVLDYQTRIPTGYFNINAGERGMVFKYKSDEDDNDILLAFYSLSDYERGTSSYSDVFDLVDISNYDMNIDLRQPKKRMGLKTKVSMQSRNAGIQAVMFVIGESLDEYENARLKKQMRLKSASIDSTPLEFVQEDWESGFTIFFPQAMSSGQTFAVDFDMEGDFLRQPDRFEDCSYPRSNGSWYPRAGYLDRSTFNFTFTHPKKLKVASTGTRISEEPDPADKDMMITKYVMNHPVALETFALGPFERHKGEIKWENGDKPTPMEFNSLSGDSLQLKETFVLQELNNSIRNFQFLFGKYPYETFGAVFHPFGFGQGFATMLTIPNTDRATKYTYSFLAHETAHQWWGNIVLWRSYRDQWLSEGFAEYSGVIYTGLRDGQNSAGKLIDDMRSSLKDPPQTVLGPGKGKLVEVGPLILGHRLETRKTYGAYNALVYNKGGLVLRMLHFMMTDPSSGNGQLFYDMMTDFVNRYRDKVASTDDFRMVANEYFARSPIGKSLGMTNLDWFFRQYVYDTAFPSYKMEYAVENAQGGGVALTGAVTQENVPDNFFMVLPVRFKFGEGKFAYATVTAMGAKTPFRFRLPTRPENVELDPQHWILSEKTSTK
jgi:Peptidase family M1 domain